MTVYDVRLSLVGSEMCIVDSIEADQEPETELDVAAELGEPGAVEDDVDNALTDELLAELEADQEPVTELDAEAELGEPEADGNELDVDDALTDELLAELEADQEPETEVDVVAEVEAPDAADTESGIDDALTDELLAELEADDSPEAEVGTSTDTELETEDEPTTEQEFAVDDVFEMGDIPSLGDDAAEVALGETGSNDLDDSLLDEAVDEFSVEEDIAADSDVPQESAPTADELEDVPGLGDWLNEESDEDSLVLEEIEDADFDELLDSIDSEVEGKPELKLDNPDLDLQALFNEPSAADSEELVLEEEPEADSVSEQQDYVDVDTLLAESNADDGIQAEETSLNLDVALAEFTGASEDDVVVDVDDGGAQAANLDLARAYIEMDDPQAAKELLQEVANQGSEEQQSEAKKLLDSMS